jgi:hypothetical protein
VDDEKSIAKRGGQDFVPGSRRLEIQKNKTGLIEIHENSVKKLQSFYYMAVVNTSYKIYSALLQYFKKLH